eukprot:768022-Hanusia_phi.AAC.1
MERGQDSRAIGLGSREEAGETPQHAGPRLVQRSQCADLPDQVRRRSMRGCLSAKLREVVTMLQLPGACPVTSQGLGFAKCCVFVWAFWKSPRATSKLKDSQSISSNYKAISLLHQVSLNPTETLSQNHSFSSHHSSSCVHIEADLCHSDYHSQAAQSAGNSELPTHQGNPWNVNIDYERNANWHGKIMNWNTSPFGNFESSKSKNNRTPRRATRARKDHNYCYYYSPSSRRLI